MRSEKPHFFRIRKAELSDVEQIAKIRLAFLQELDEHSSDIDYEKLLDQTREYFARKIQHDELHTWFVLDKEKIVTVGSLLLIDMPPSIVGYGGGLEGYIFNIYTLPEYRRQGLAKKLTTKIIQEAKLKLCNRLWLMAAEDIYKDFGFKYRNDVMDYTMALRKNN